MLFVLLGLASAAVVESEPLTTRGAAVDLRDAAAEAGHDARLVREYASGRGWEYVVRIEGFETAEDANTAALALAEISGTSLAVLEGATPVLVEPPAASVQPVVEKLPGADLVQAQAVRALGGREGGAAALASAQAVRFEYERTLLEPSGTVRAHHVLVRQAGTVRLRIDGEAPVQPSLTQVGGEGAWIWSDAELLERDVDRAQEILSGFEPEALLALPLGFAGLVASDPVWSRLETVGTEVSDGRELVILEAGMEGGRGLRVLVDNQTWLPARVVIRSDAGESKHLFADWRELDTGLVVPFDVRLERDGVPVSQLVVVDLQLSDALPAGTFEPPGTP